ncbi:MAG TPA: YceI family protein [Pyrinomonadaceae bacterium]|nr:YceI family protein [Pyrinomonadaceae bacterium]
MRLWKLLLLASALVVSFGTDADAKTHKARARSHGADARTSSVVAVAARQTAACYRIDAARSTFVVRAYAGGVLWFKGHDHILAARDFSGEVSAAPDAVASASLVLRVRADSLAETRDVFTEPQKQIINRELREIVLQTDKYPEILFRSTDVAVKLEKGLFKVKVGGDLTLHGVTRRIVIPAEVTFGGDSLRARGTFKINRSDFKVRATSAFHGTVRVRDKLKFTFDIVARRI